jgi:predicted  nucleic acid-binding Zn-ribbon protein
MKIISFKVKEIEGPVVKLRRKLRERRKAAELLTYAIDAATSGAWALARLGLPVPDIKTFGFTPRQTQRIIKKKLKFAQHEAERLGAVILDVNPQGDVVLDIDASRQASVHVTPLEAPRAEDSPASVSTPGETPTMGTWGWPLLGIPPAMLANVERWCFTDNAPASGDACAPKAEPDSEPAPCCQHAEQPPVVAQASEADSCPQDAEDTQDDPPLAKIRTVLSAEDDKRELRAAYTAILDRLAAVEAGVKPAETFARVWDWIQAELRALRISQDNESTGTGAVLEAHGGQLAELREAVAKLQGLAEGTGDTPLGSQLQALQSAVHDLRAEVPDLRVRVEDAALEAQNRLAALESIAQSQPDDASSVMARVAELQDCVDKLEAWFTGLDSTVEGVQALLKNLEAEGKDVRAVVADAVGRVATCEQAITPVVDPKKPISNQALVLKVAAITAADDATRTCLKALQERQDEVEGSLAALRKELEMETVGLPS